MPAPAIPKPVPPRAAIVAIGLAFLFAWRANIIALALLFAMAAAVLGEKASRYPGSGLTGIEDVSLATSSALVLEAAS